MSIESKKTTYLSETLARKLIFLSYKFSQSDRGLQNNILHRLHDFYSIKIVGFDKFLFAESFINSLFAVDRPGDFLISVNKKHVPIKRIEAETELGQIKHCLDILENGKTGDLKDPIMSIEELLKEFIDTDYRYLIDKGGRPNREIDSVNKGLGDPFFSFVVTYVLKRKNTGDPGLDDLFSKFKKKLDNLNRDENKQLFLKLDNIISTFNIKHNDHVSLS